jgi:hypothetical protein
LATRMQKNWQQEYRTLLNDMAMAISFKRALPESTPDL